MGRRGNRSGVISRDRIKNIVASRADPPMRRESARLALNTIFHFVPFT